MSYSDIYGRVCRLHWRDPSKWRSEFVTVKAMTFPIIILMSLRWLLWRYWSDTLTWTSDHFGNVCCVINVTCLIHMYVQYVPLSFIVHQCSPWNTSQLRRLHSPTYSYCSTHSLHISIQSLCFSVRQKDVSLSSRKFGLLQG